MHINIAKLHRSVSGNGVLFWVGTLLSFFVFFYLFSDICFSFSFGFVLAYLSIPLMDFLSKYVSRNVAGLCFTLLLICSFIIAGVEFLPKIKEQFVLLCDNAPVYYDYFIDFLNNNISAEKMSFYKEEIVGLKFEMQKYLNRKLYIFASVVGGIASKTNQITNFFSFFVIMPISFYYFLKDWNIFYGHIYELVPPRQRETFNDAINIIRTTLTDFLHGQFYVVTILSAYYSIVLFLINVENYIGLGISSGLLSFIPFIGAAFSCFFALFISAQTLTITKMCAIVCIYIIGQILEGYFLSPKFVGKKTGLHPLWILFSFFAGIELRGIIGVLIAIPIAAVIKNLMRFTVKKYKSSNSYKK